MQQKTRKLANDVSDNDLEFIERIIFAEYNDALEKDSQGHDMTDEIMQLEQALNAITLVREHLDEERTEAVERTAELVEGALD